MAKANFNELINSEKPVLIDFYADWCGPCQAMGPILQDLKSEIGETGTIVKINIDKNPEIAGTFGVRSIPAFFVFQNGDVKWSALGMQGKQQLKEAMGLVEA